MPKNSWRDTILNDFVPKVSKLTLVSDPDGLLSEEKLAMELRERGFDLIEFNDPVEFRYAYESKYRLIWDRGESTDLVVILRTQNSELETLPYDLVQAGRKLSFNLGGLFPNLSYPVIEALDTSFLDALFDAQEKFHPDRMGDNATRDFILRHVFEIAAELIRNEVDLLRCLLRLHYNNIKIPKSLSNRLVQVIKGHEGLRSWPLEEILTDDSAFFTFLQERWPLFISKLSDKGKTREDLSGYGFKYPGPSSLPFDHQDIRIYMDNLFIEGKLAPVSLPPALNPESETLKYNSWILSGIVRATGQDENLRISRLFELIESELPKPDCRYSDWTSFALKWAELTALIHGGSRADEIPRFLKADEEMNTAFAQWLDSHYSSLINLPPTNPAMLHHLIRRLARDMEDMPDSRIALIVADGLALDQWIAIRQILHEQNHNLTIRESAIFSWIPTLTSVSRQAIFSGKAPIYFPSSIGNTNSEGNLWKQFWEDFGISKLDIAYQRGLGDGDAATLLDDILHPGQTKVLGLVVDKIDKIMHGMQLGSAGMHNQIKQWCGNGFLNSLIDYLLDHKFQVWLTSDHGNIECRGMGKPSEGVIAETRGERVRVYPTAELRETVADKFSFARKWEPIGLPSGYYPLIAKGRYAFVNPDDIIVGHGGTSIEEVIVPLVKFERKTR